MSQQVAVQNIPISKLRNSKFNVRKQAGDISELVLSVKSVGILEPIIVRPVGKEFEVVIGSRRFAAAKKAELRFVPAVVKELTDAEAIVESLTENLQRGEIGEEDIVEAFRALQSLDSKRWTGETFAKTLGKSKAWVSRLLGAYDSLQKLKQFGLAKGMTARPSPAEREKGIVPLEHLEQIETAIRTVSKSGAIKGKEIETKREELAKAVIDEPIDDAIRIINRFKMYPEKPVSDIKEQAMAERAGVALKTYLPPKVARQIEETTGRPIEEGITQVIERGLLTAPVTTQEKPQEKQGYMALEEPISAQYQHQREWNLEQLVGRDFSAKGKRFTFDFLTVGYSQKTMDDLLNSLKAAEAKVLVDVRKSPQSMYRPEFNKDALERELKTKGIGYVHLPDLGIPRELRDEVYGGKTTAKSVLDQYERDVLRNGGLHNLMESVKGKGTFAVMCTEVDPTNCHRHKIAEALTEEGLVGYDL